MEDVAEDFLEELIQRSMIQVVRRRSNGAVERCRIHDLLRDLAISEAKQCKFLDIYENDSSVSPSRSHRLSIHPTSGNWDTTMTTQLCSTANHLRSLLYFDGSLENTLLKSFFGGFKLLRVLDLEGARDFHSLSKEIGQLILLKYISLARTKIKSLPRSIGNLKNLQTIDFSYTLFNHAPNIIWTLQELRNISFHCPSHLSPNITYGSTSLSHRPLQIDRLRNLQTLWLPTGSWIEGGLHKLTNLREMRIEGDVGLYRRALSNSIVKLDRLRVLSLTNIPRSNPTSLPLVSFSNHVHIYKMILRGRLDSLLQPHDFPPNLIELCLEFSDLKPENDPIVILDKLPNLKVLHLMTGVFEGKKMVYSAGGFSNLQVLRLEKLNALEELIMEQGAMPNLRYLHILGTGLKMLPDRLGHLRALKKLWLQGFPEDRVEEGVGEDWDKIKHIPFVSVKR